MSWAGGWGHALRTAVAEPFTEATGIPVRQATHIGLALPEALETALHTGQRPPFDVVWSNSGPTLRMARANLTEPLDGVAGLSELLPRAKPEGCGPNPHAWPFAYAYVVYYVLTYRDELFPDGPPQSWEVLLDPRHHGRIALYPGGNGFYPIAQTLRGGRLSDIPGDMGACWQFVRELATSIGQLDYSIGMGEILRRKELDLCFRALTNALAFRAEGLPVSFCTPREGITDTLDCLWIPKGVPAPQLDAAKQFIAFALSPDVQSRWCDALGAMPLHPKAQIPSLLASHPGIPEDATSHAGILHLPEELKADHQLEWEARFRAETTGPHPTD